MTLRAYNHTEWQHHFIPCVGTQTQNVFLIDSVPGCTSWAWINTEQKLQDLDKYRPNSTNYLWNPCSTWQQGIYSSIPAGLIICTRNERVLNWKHVFWQVASDVFEKWTGLQFGHNGTVVPCLYEQKGICPSPKPEFPKYKYQYFIYP